jgi:hypothetical protein
MQAKKYIEEQIITASGKREMVLGFRAWAIVNDYRGNARA